MCVLAAENPARCVRSERNGTIGVQSGWKVGGRGMPIRYLLEQSSFGPDEVKTIISGFDRLCARMQLVDRTDPLMEIVAKAVLTVARDGVRDPATIERRAMALLIGSWQEQARTGSERPLAKK